MIFLGGVTLQDMDDPLSTKKNLVLIITALCAPFVILALFAFLFLFLQPEKPTGTKSIEITNEDALKKRTLRCEVLAKRPASSITEEYCNRYCGYFRDNACFNPADNPETVREGEHCRTLGGVYELCATYYDGNGRDVDECLKMCIIPFAPPLTSPTPQA